MNIVIISLLGFVLGSLMTSCRPLPTLDDAPAPSVGALAPTRKNAVDTAPLCWNYSDAEVMVDNVEPASSTAWVIAGKNGSSVSSARVGDGESDLYFWSRLPFNVTDDETEDFYGYQNSWPSLSSHYDLDDNGWPDEIAVLGYNYGVGIKNSLGGNYLVQIRLANQPESTLGVMVGSKGFRSSATEVSYEIRTYPEIPFRLSSYSTTLGSVDESTKTLVMQGLSSYVLSADDVKGGAFYVVEPAYDLVTRFYNRTRYSLDYVGTGVGSGTIGSGGYVELHAPVSGVNVTLSCNPSVALSVGSFAGGSNIAEGADSVTIEIGSFVDIYVMETEGFGTGVDELGQVFGLIAQALASWTFLFGIKIYGGLTLGTLILIPFMVTLLVVVVRLIKK